MVSKWPILRGLEGRALADNASKKLIAYHEAGWLEGWWPKCPGPGKVGSCQQKPKIGGLKGMMVVNISHPFIRGGYFLGGVVPGSWGWKNPLDFHDSIGEPPAKIACIVKSSFRFFEGSLFLNFMESTVDQWGRANNIQICWLKWHLDDTWHFGLVLWRVDQK